MAFAISTICCSGMLRVSTVRSGSIDAPTRASIAAAASRRRFQSIGRQARPDSSDRAMFSATVRWGKSEGCW